MTDGPPSTAASSSKTPASSSDASPPTSQPQPPDPTFAAWNGNHGPPPQYPVYSPSYALAPSQNYAHPGMPMPMSYYPNVSANPYATYMAQPQFYGRPPPPSKIFSSTPTVKPPRKPKATTQAVPRARTPPLPEPETYKHWDDVVKKFLVRTKFIQTLKGFEHDMLVVNPQWEREVIPEALKEMVAALQAILGKISGKKRADEDTMDTSADVDILATGSKPDEESAVDNRKLEYITSASGTKLQSHSSINKSISQFLALTRARNDTSNRAEFLYSLTEKRRRLQEQGQNPNEAHISSCARVDAKPIDRDKQMKFDIAKNGEGPLTKTVKTGSANVASREGAQAGADGQQPPKTAPSSLAQERKRKFVDFEFDADSKAKAKRKSKGKRKEAARDPSPTPDDEDEETFEARLTAGDRPGLDERLKNIEEHFAVRYVPSIPRTLFARLKNLEDQIIKLEQEYPPWAALHFNQPSRGWPAAPRATPIIVPPHLRSSSLATPPQLSAITNSLSTSANASSASTPSQSMPPPAGPPIKPKKANSSLHRAVLDRLEVQREIDEMNSIR